MNAKSFVFFLLAAVLLTTALPPGVSVAAAQQPAAPPPVVTEQSSAAAQEPPMPPPEAIEQSSATEQEPPAAPATAPATGIAAEVVETETGIYYTVKKGDTLWDLSRKFADSPYVWPDMWSDNSQITNPHRIYPGERIRLYRREDLTQMKTEEPPEEASVAAVEPEPLPLPPPEEAPELPPEPLQEEKYVTFTRIDQVGFIRKPAVEPHGEIFSVIDDKQMIATDDIVYIRRIGDHVLVPGSRYTIYRTPVKVWDENSGDYLGFQHYLLGVVQIQRTEGKNYAMGKVEQAFLNIRVGDRLMPYARRSADLPRRRPAEDLSGEIVMAEAGNLIIGDNVTAFINRGKKHGVQVGDVYNVFYEKSGRLNPRSNRTITLESVDFGEFIVLLTENATSTVLITKAQRQIQPGTKFHTP